jgi:hypothetical protein
MEIMRFFPVCAAIRSPALWLMREVYSRTNTASQHAMSHLLCVYADEMPARFPFAVRNRVPSIGNPLKMRWIDKHQQAIVRRLIGHRL